MINKRELAKRTAGYLQGMTIANTEIVIDAIMDAILDTLKDGEEIYLYGFGKFSVSNYKEIDKKTPTGEVVTIPARKVPKFKFFKTTKAEFV